MDFYEAVGHAARIGTAGRIDLHGYSRDVLPAFCVRHGYQVGAEIGVYKGAFTEKFCAAGLRMYAIDPWRAFAGQGRTQRQQARQDFLYGHATRTLAPYADRCTILRQTSAEAVASFPPGSLDVVYIDGDHRFSAVAFDLEAWWGRLRRGGMLAGHDLFCTDPGATNVVCQVEHVVTAFMATFGLPRWFTFGRSRPLELEPKDDRFLSWACFKP